jgi:hypothetical protein
MYSMKNKHPLFVLLLFIVLLTVACNFNGQRSKTVKINDGNTSIKIEYRGKIIFTEDGRGIEAISPEGYVKYKNGDNRFYAHTDDDGNINYKIYSNGKRLHPADEGARNFMANTIQIIEEHYYK